MFEYGEPGYYSFLYTNTSILPNNTDENGDYKGVMKALDWIENDRIEPFIIVLDGKGGHPPYRYPATLFQRCYICFCICF